MSNNLIKKIIIRGKLKAETGLAIGGSNTAMGIGGVDKGVIRNPVTQQPYIPGSSLKGKMRSLTEIQRGEIGDKSMGVVKNGPCERDGSFSARLFGNASGSDKQRPSRLIVRDATLDKGQIEKNYFKNTDLLFTEIKTEVVIDRITAKAMPRQMERVPAGSKFDFELILNVFEGEDEKALMLGIFSALQLVQNDYIGGSGSRGSGQVSFHITEVIERTAEFYLFKADQNTEIKKVYEPYFPR